MLHRMPLDAACGSVCLYIYITVLLWPCLAYYWSVADQCLLWLLRTYTRVRHICSVVYVVHRCVEF